MGNIENIHIAVCDDEELTHREVEEKLIEYRESRKCVYKLSHYDSAQMLLNETEEIHILLLDIDMPFKDAFKIGATRFVTKPIEKDELFEALDSAVASLAGYGTVTVKYNGEDCTVRQRDIYMVEAKRDYVKIYLKDKVCESNHSLKDLAENLDDRLFIYVHRSYLVNMLYVSDIKNGYVELSGGKKVSVARRKSKEVHQKIIEFDVNCR